MSDTWIAATRQPIDVARIGAFHPIEVLYAFEGPCIFTVDLLGEGLALAYLCEELDDERLLRFIVAKTTPDDVEALKAATLPVAAVLGSAAWIVDVDYSHRPVRAYRTRPEQLPEDALPDPDVGLFAASVSTSARAVVHSRG